MGPGVKLPNELVLARTVKEVATCWRSSGNKDQATSDLAWVSRKLQAPSHKRQATSLTMTEGYYRIHTLALGPVALFKTSTGHNERNYENK